MGPWKTTVSRVLVVACFHIVSLYIMSVMVVVGGTRYPKYKAPLPDLAFDVLAPYPDLSWLPNTLIYLLLLATLIRCLLSRQGLTIIRRVLFVHAITMLMRSLTLVATSYPDPSLPCVDYMPPSDVNPFWANTLGNADLITCGDLMFSGHTLIYVVLALAWQKYFYVIEKVIFWMFTLVAITTLLVARLHYLNDIIVAMYVVVCVWHVYHMHAESDRRQLNPIVGWLEADIHRRVARERRRQKAAALAAAKLRRKGRSGTGSGAGGGASTVTDYDSDADDRATPSSDVPSAGSIGRIQRFFQSGAEAAEAAATQLRTNSVRRSSSTPHQSSKHRRQPSTDRSFREDDDADEDFMPPQAGSAAPPPSRPFLTVTPAPVAAAVTPTVPLDV